MFLQLLPAFRLTVFMTILTGLLYPLGVTVISQLLFRDKANGSLIERNGHVVGSSLIGQQFNNPRYFRPRPSAAGNDGYDPMASGGSNYGPTNQKLADRVKASVAQFRKENPNYSGPIPADLLTASASGLDPHISPASALAQLDRVAAERRAGPAAVKALIAAHTESADLGFLGEPRVNVLLLNLDLDEKFPLPTK